MFKKAVSFIIMIALIFSLVMFSGTTVFAAGSIAGNSTCEPLSNNLSDEGTADWAHWGLVDTTSFNHKNNVTQEISNYTKLGNGSVIAATTGNDNFKYTWTGGTPTSSATDTQHELWFSGSTGTGFQFTVTAGTDLKTIKIHTSDYNAKLKFEAILSDGSASSYVDYFNNTSGFTQYRIYTITYKANSNNQTLTIKGTIDTLNDQYGGIGLVAATVIDSGGQHTLQALSSNPRYFTSNGSTAIYMTGLSDGFELQDNAWDNNLTFDFSSYLSFLVNHNMNHIRLWCVDGTRSTNGNNSYLATPMPFARVSGHGNANDGQYKFDLTQFNQSYFDRIRSRCIAAGNDGIYVQIMLFQGWTGVNNSIYWPYNVFNSSNNINGINGDTNSNGTGEETQNLSIKAVTDIQEKYIKKVIDTVNDLDNVMYEIDNEAGTKDFQCHMTDIIHAYEKGRNQHPIVMSCASSFTNTDLYGSTAEAIEPDTASGTIDYVNNPVDTDGTKVVDHDTDHTNALNNTDPKIPWRSFLRGYNVILLDQDVPFDLTSGSSWNSIRNACARTSYWASNINLAHMPPQDSKSQTNYCLANIGSEYLVYQPNSSSFWVNFPSAATYNYTWYNPATGSTVQTGSVSVTSGNNTFTLPGSFGDTSVGEVLYLIINGATPTPTATAISTPTPAPADTTVDFQAYTTNGQAVNGTYDGIDWGSGQCAVWGDFGSRVMYLTGSPKSITLPSGAYIKQLKIATWNPSYPSVTITQGSNSKSLTVTTSMSTYTTGWSSAPSTTVTITTNSTDPGCIAFDDIVYGYGAASTSTPTPTYTPTPTPTPTSTPTPTPTSNGRDAFSQVEAESYDSQSGIQAESCSDIGGGQDVGFINSGDYAVYNNINFDGGATGFQARVASNASGGNIEIRLDSPSGSLAGTCTVSGTGGWQTWTTVNCGVSGASGTHNLYLVFTGQSGYLYNLNWFKFTSSATPTPTPTPAATATPTPTPAATATPLLSDDFEDGNANGWTSGSGTWSVATDGSTKVYRQSDNTVANARSVAGRSSWSNYEITAKVKTESFDSGGYAGVGLNVRYQDSSNYYYFFYYKNDGTLKIQKYVGGTATTLASANFTFNTGTWYTFKAVVNGSDLELWVDGNQKLITTDSTYTQGSIAVAAHRSDSKFDDISVVAK